MTPNFIQNKVENEYIDSRLPLIKSSLDNIALNQLLGLLWLKWWIYLNGLKFNRTRTEAKHYVSKKSIWNRELFVYNKMTNLRSEF